MCHQCNYRILLTSSKLKTTPNRLRVLEVVGNNTYPLSAADIYQTLARSTSINRVTVYRILDLLVAHGLVDRLSGGRAFYYGLATMTIMYPTPIFTAKTVVKWIV